MAERLTRSARRSELLDSREEVGRHEWRNASVEVDAVAQSNELPINSPLKPAGRADLGVEVVDRITESGGLASYECVVGVYALGVALGQCVSEGGLSRIEARSREVQHFGPRGASHGVEMAHRNSNPVLHILTVDVL